MDVFAAAQGKVQHPGPDSIEREAVDEQETPEIAIFDIGVERDAPAELEVADADLVERELVGGDPLQGVDPQLVLERRHRRGRGLSADLHQVVAPGEHRRVRHPHNRGLELVTATRAAVGGGDEISAAGVDLVLEGEDHRLPADGHLEIAVGGDDPGHPRLAPGGQDDDPVPARDMPAIDEAGKSAEFVAGPADRLDPHAERAISGQIVDLDALEVLHERGALIPGHSLAGDDDVVALQARRGNAGDCLQAQVGGELVHAGLDLEK